MKSHELDMSTVFLSLGSDPGSFIKTMYQGKGAIRKMMEETDISTEMEEPLKRFSHFLEMSPKDVQNYFFGHPEEVIYLHRLTENMSPSLFWQIGILSPCISLETNRKVWRGLWLDHISEDQRLTAVVAVCGIKIPSEKTWNFVTCRDLTEYQCEHSHNNTTINSGLTISGFESRAINQATISAEHKALVSAFRSDMVRQAQESSSAAVLGFFEMDREPLPMIDEAIVYDSIRMSISPDGIWFSFLDHHQKTYFPGFWSAESYYAYIINATTSNAVDMMFSCVWRDASVVVRTWYEERSRAASDKKKKEKKTKRQKKIVLPRSVKICRWSLEEDRDIIIRSSHGVRAFYRILPEGHRASDQAKQTAGLFDYPQPPEGFTFVQPHIRGGDDATKITNAPKVICKGLQTARIGLSMFDQGSL